MKLNEIARRKFQRCAMRIPLNSKNSSYRSNGLWHLNRRRPDSRDALLDERSIPLEGRNGLGFLLAFATCLGVTHAALLQTGSISGAATGGIYICRTATSRAKVQPNGTESQKHQPD
jgi:hypothetical protein